MWLWVNKIFNEYYIKSSNPEDSSLLSGLLAYIRAFRPITRLWFDIIFPTAVLLIATSGNAPAIDYLIYAAIFILIHTAATLENDVQDIETDRASVEPSKKTRPIATGKIQVKTARALSITLVIMGIALLTLKGIHATGYVLFLWALIMLHEKPPIRTQSRPLLSLVAGGGGTFLIAYGVVWSSKITLDNKGWLFLLFCAIYLGIAEVIIKDLRDHDNDRKGGKRTFPTTYGASIAALASGLMVIIAAWIWWLLSQQVAIVLHEVGLILLITFSVYLFICAYKFKSTQMDKHVFIRIHILSKSFFTFCCLLVVATYWCHLYPF